MSDQTLPASFRDPSGYVFVRDEKVFRRINAPYFDEYRTLMESGLYQNLVDRGWIVAHEEVPSDNTTSIVILPTQIPYVSYPHEWSFSQYKDAAKLTLDIQRVAMKYGMSLKDASAYNVQFLGTKPTFVDTLSFETLDPGRPWVAYKQYCEHFLGPLLLMSRCHPGLRKLLIGSVEGIPLDLVSSILPRTSFLKYSILSHIHMHSRSQQRHADARQADGNSPGRMNLQLLNALNTSLGKAVDSCRMQNRSTEWGNYYEETNYSDAAMSEKESTVSELVSQHLGKNQHVHDLGANTGRFSQIAARYADYVVSHDIDELAVDGNYTQTSASDASGKVLPLVLDLCNPSPSIGWALEERSSFFDRCQSEFVIALALIHHLAISNNTPLGKISEVFARLASILLIEFVPKEDSQVQRLLASREDIFPNYDASGFEQAFQVHFEIIEKRSVAGSCRTIYLLQRRG